MPKRTPSPPLPGLASARDRAAQRWRLAPAASSPDSDPPPALAPAPLRPPPPPPTPDDEPMQITPALTRSLIEYCASIPGGARAESAYSWLKSRGASRLQAETLLEELQADGRLVREERPAAGGTEVVRYRPGDPAVQGAPLPRSDAPPAELAAAPAQAPEEMPPVALPVVLEAEQAPAASPPAAPASAPPPPLEAPPAPAAPELEEVAPPAHTAPALAEATAPAPVLTLEPPAPAAAPSAPSAPAPAPFDPRMLLLVPIETLVAFTEASRELLQVEAEETAIEQARAALEARAQQERAALEARLQGERAALEARASAVQVDRARVEERRQRLLVGDPVAPAAAPAPAPPASPPAAPAAPAPALPTLASAPSTAAPAGQVFGDNLRLALGSRVLLVIRPGEHVCAADLLQRLRGADGKSVATELSRQARLTLLGRVQIGVYRLTPKGMTERLRLGAMRAA